MQNKYIPLIALGMASYYCISAAFLIRQPCRVVIDGAEDGRPAVEKAAAKAQPTEAGFRAAEPVHKSLIRCLNDMDDLLDTIVDEASFDRARPKLLQRARDQAAQARQHANAGMQQMSQLAAYELREATARHGKSLARALKVAPGVYNLFEIEIAAILK